MYRSGRLVSFFFSLSIRRYLYLAGHVTFFWINNTPLLLPCLSAGTEDKNRGGDKAMYNP